MILLIPAVITAIAAYLLGSVNTAIIVTKLLQKKDIRDLGSGNAGTTNVLRNLGKAPAAITLAGDVLKAVLSVTAGRIIFDRMVESNLTTGEFIAAFFVLLGHLFPLYYKFKGGKGIAVAVGIFIMINPIVLLIAIGIFILTIMFSKMVSLSSIMACLVFPPVTFALRYLSGADLPIVLADTFFTLMISLIVIFMHKENIKRILKGTEHKFEK